MATTLQHRSRSMNSGKKGTSNPSTMSCRGRSDTITNMAMNISRVIVRYST
ncbi:hypothetical protein D3C79_1054850 [compost metagenome]